MDFVTITDHDTIAGVLEIADEPDVFVSEELTAWFRDEAQAVHVLCFGITGDDHDWLQAHRGDVVACAEYLREHEIACALAHPFFHVAAPLTPGHRRTLAELFGVWETRNGARPRELNAPAAVYIETQGGIAVGGSDDHAGVDVGRTYTQAPPAATPAELLNHIRAGRVSPHGEQGSAAKWAHSALVLAARTLAGGAASTRASSATPAPIPDPRAALELAERVMLEGDAGRTSAGTGLGPEDGRRLLQAWLGELGLDVDTGGLLAMLQAPEFNHSDLERRARRAHERKLMAASQELIGTADTASAASATRLPSLQDAGASLFSACLPALPYIPAAAFLARERAKLSAPEDEPLRVAVIADGVRAVHGVAQTLVQLRERGLPGYEIDVIGTDASVDRRLSAVTEIELPFYPGLKLGVPSLFAVTEALSQRSYDLVHVCAPGPAGIAALLIARVMGIPVAGSYHTELQTYARVRARDPRLEQAVGTVLAAFYGQCRVVLSPSLSADRSLGRLGIAAEDTLALGARGGSGALSSWALRARSPARRLQRPLRRPAQPGEGHRSARSGVPDRARARSAAAPGAGRWRPRGGRPALPPGSSGDVPGLAAG